MVDFEFETDVNRPTKDEVPDVPAGQLVLMLITSFLPLAFLILAVLGSILFGLATPTEAASIAGMPDRQTLRAMMVGVISAPARKLATVLNEVGASTARCMQARADQGDAA